MVKKIIPVLVLTMAIVGGASALDLSAGALLGPNFGGKTDSDLKEETFFGFGFGAYFDATFVEASVGMNLVTTYYDGEKVFDYTYNYLTLGLLGKYPIALGEKFSIAPAVGFDYQLFLGDSDGNSRQDYQDMYDALYALSTLFGGGFDEVNVAERHDNFIIKFGAIADFAFTDHLYARGELLGAFGLPHKDSDPADSSFGADIKIGVGYKF
jgi:hypothetical protein